MIRMVPENKSTIQEYTELLTNLKAVSEKAEKGRKSKYRSSDKNKYVGKLCHRMKRAQNSSVDLSGIMSELKSVLRNLVNTSFITTFYSERQAVRAAIKTLDAAPCVQTTKAIRSSSNV